jgi:hypothetical protein
MPLATTPNPVCVRASLAALKRLRFKALGLGNGAQEKRNWLPRNTRLLEEDTVIEHTKDCLLEEAGQCDCDAMTDEEIDAELLEKEDAKK